MIGRITIGRGRNRLTAILPSDKIGREQAADDLKQYLGRQGLNRNLAASRMRVAAA